MARQIAVYINAFHGKVRTVGPFETVESARAWVENHERDDQKLSLWNISELEPNAEETIEARKITAEEVAIELQGWVDGGKTASETVHAVNNLVWRHSE